MDLSKEIEIAKNARKNAYVPYTKYYVGCALKASSGRIYSGCNIQNHAIQSYCAERVAFLKAISEGERSFEHIVVCGGPSDKLEDCLPCGYCRQFMSEFIDEKFKVYALGPNNQITPYTMNDLLPNNFSL